MTHFSLDEFTCKCGCGKRLMSFEFIAKLDIARTYANIPFIIASGYRCEQHNIDVGGKPGSAHRTGRAADISAPDSRTRFKILNALLTAGFTRIGIGNTFIHVDMDQSKPDERIWVY